MLCYRRDGCICKAERIAKVEGGRRTSSKSRPADALWRGDW